MMLVFSTVDARRSPESMKFPVFSLLAGNFGFRDGFARDCLLQQRVHCEPCRCGRGWPDGYLGVSLQEPGVASASCRFTVYSNLPIFCVPTGVIRFWIVNALTTSFAEKP